MTLFAGIDVGSSATKAVIINEQKEVLGRAVGPSGADFSQASEKAFEEALALANASADQVASVVSTGYGRTNVDFTDSTRTEIDCHARGAFHYFPRAITVVDIGGQDNKVIQLDDRGRRTGFTMNRKCAAGTGSFLEEMALRLNIPLSDFSDLARRSKDPSVAIGSFCTVFAMTEILAKIRAGVRPEDLARAALESVARRVLETRVITGDVVVTGGVAAHNVVLPEILGKILDAEVHVPPYPQHVGAMGAALISLTL